MVIRKLNITKLKKNDNSGKFLGTVYICFYGIFWKHVHLTVFGAAVGTKTPLFLPSAGDSRAVPGR